MDKTYRNQTPTMNQIQLLATIRITNPSEAIAFLRAVQPVYTQIAGVLQRTGLRAQHAINQEMVQDKPIVVDTPAPVPEPTKKFEPEEMGGEEEYTEDEIEARVAKLKSARKVKENE